MDEDDLKEIWRGRNRSVKAYVVTDDDDNV